MALSNIKASSKAGSKQQRELDAIAIIIDSLGAAHSNPAAVHSLVVENLLLHAMPSAWSQLHRYGLLPNYTNVSLTQNKLLAVPEELWAFSNLAVLLLDHNRLSEIPAHIAHLSALKKLSVAHNRLAALPPALCALKQLKVVVASHNDIIEVPASFASVTSLERIELLANPNLHTIPPEVASLPVLRKLECDSGIVVPSSLLTAGYSDPMVILRYIETLEQKGATVDASGHQNLQPRCFVCAQPSARGRRATSCRLCGRSGCPRCVAHPAHIPVFSPHSAVLLCLNCVQAVSAHGYTTSYAPPSPTSMLPSSASPARLAATNESPARSQTPTSQQTASSSSASSVALPPPHHLAPPPRPGGRPRTHSSTAVELEHEFALTGDELRLPVAKQRELCATKLARLRVEVEKRANEKAGLLRLCGFPGMSDSSTQVITAKREIEKIDQWEVSAKHLFESLNGKLHRLVELDLLHAGSSDALADSEADWAYDGGEEEEGDEIAYEEPASRFASLGSSPSSSLSALLSPRREDSPNAMVVRPGGPPVKSGLKKAPPHVPSSALNVDASPVSPRGPLVPTTQSSQMQSGQIRAVLALSPPTARPAVPKSKQLGAAASAPRSNSPVSAPAAPAPKMVKPAPPHQLSPSVSLASSPSSEKPKQLKSGGLLKKGAVIIKKPASKAVSGGAGKAAAKKDAFPSWSDFSASSAPERPSSVLARLLWDYDGDDDEEIKGAMAGDLLTITDTSDPEWWHGYVMSRGEVSAGYVPRSYLNVMNKS